VRSTTLRRGERQRLVPDGYGDLISAGAVRVGRGLSGLGGVLVAFALRRVLGGCDAALGLGLDVGFRRECLDGVAELFAGWFDLGADLFVRFRLVAISAVSWFRRRSSPALLDVLLG
jgi:hypothetical protein